MAKLISRLTPAKAKNHIWKRIEVVITAPTRNRVIQRWVRGFESHRFRQIPYQDLNQCR